MVLENNINQNHTDLFNCYVRAVNEGVTQLMNSCNFQYSPNPSGTCGNSIGNLALPLNSKMFMNCSDLNLQFNFTVSGEEVVDLDGTLLFIIDNSGLFPSASQPT